MLMVMCLPEFDIYQGTVALNCLKAPQTLHILIIIFIFLNCLKSGMKFTLSDVTSFLPDSQAELKKYTRVCPETKGIYAH